MTRSRQTADWGSRAGLAKIVPSSVAVGSGTGSASALGTVTFSGASSVSLNGVFTSAYENYKITYYSTASADTDLLIRFRNAGTDTTTNYTYALVYTELASGPSRGVSNSNTTMYFAPARQTITIASVDIYKPQISTPTGLTGLGYGRSGTFVSSYIETSAQIDSTSFDGCTIYASSGTVTGTLSIYGYNN
jgi:hypothetical protein